MFVHITIYQLQDATERRGLGEESEDDLGWEFLLGRQWDCNLGLEDPYFYSSCPAWAEKLPVLLFRGLHDWWQAFFLL